MLRRTALALISLSSPAPSVNRQSSRRWWRRSVWTLALTALFIACALSACGNGRFDDSPDSVLIGSAGATGKTLSQSENQPPSTRSSLQGVKFTSVSAGGLHTCGVTTDGAVVCWGYDRYGFVRSAPPEGSFASVSAGTAHTCGVKADGAVACWGDDQFGKTTAPPGEFASVSAGTTHTCGLRTDGSIACRGNDKFGQSTPPDGVFASVSAGAAHTCGIRRNGLVACWGFADYGQATPPAGEFASVSAGGSHTCGVRADSTVTCWGRNEFGESTPPAGSFDSVSAGGVHNCGVRTDGTVACWGSNVDLISTARVDRSGGSLAPDRADSDEDASKIAAGQATPPEGEFVSVSAGLGHTCGVTTDHTVVCWGYDALGRATPP